MSHSSQTLATRILWSMLLGVGLGCAAVWIGAYQPRFLDACRSVAVAVCDPLGRVFLHLLFFVVVPLVFASLALGVVQLGKVHRLGPLAGRTFLLFGLNMIIGVALGLALMNLFQPGNSVSPEIKTRLLAEYGGAAQAVAETRPGIVSFSSLVDMFLPRNLLRSLVEFQVLPLVLFALLIGVAGIQLAEEQRARLQAALEIVASLMTRIVHYALLIAPLAVPAMLFSVIVKVGVDIVKALGSFVILCLAAMALHLFGILSLWIRLLTRRKLRDFYRAARVVLVTAFATSSSNATLPASLHVCREELGVRPEVAGFVLPLGATMNMSGTALYEGCVVLFIAQIYGVPLNIGLQITLLLLAVLSAVAVAGIPGGSLPLLAGLLASFGVPPEGLAIIIGTDRILDMARTTVNVAADLVTAVIVDEKESQAPGFRLSSSS